MSYVVLRFCWCIIIVLNVHVPSEEKSSDSEYSFCVVNFPECHMKIF